MPQEVPPPDRFADRHIGPRADEIRDMLALLDSQIRHVPGVAEIEPWIYLELHYRPVTPAEAIARMASR